MFTHGCHQLCKVSLSLVRSERMSGQLLADHGQTFTKNDRRWVEGDQTL